MQTKLVERREYKRIFFSIKDGPIAVLNFPKNYKEAIIATVMDLSLGGLGLSLKKKGEQICVGEHLFISGIEGVKNLTFTAEIEIEIKWIRNYESFEHTLLGCEFLNISDADKAAIQKFINSWVCSI